MINLIGVMQTCVQIMSAYVGWDTKHAYFFNVLGDKVMMDIQTEEATYRLDYRLDTNKYKVSTFKQKIVTAVEEEVIKEGEY